MSFDKVQAGIMIKSVENIEISLKEVTAIVREDHDKISEVYNWYQDWKVVKKFIIRGFVGLLFSAGVIKAAFAAFG